ncbi:MAG: peptide ABC transporter substrate-binding protein [Gammaproteobacteria bacterium]|nr:peptide ABC transporter substrate-binding protein [Gammaproteobacteria bacterium]
MNIKQLTNRFVIILFIFLNLNLFNITVTYADAKIIKRSELAEDQTFHRGNGEEVDSLDPARATGVPAFNVIADLYEGLMTIDQSGQLILGQAEKYTISKDLKTYTFTLKDNLKWSNGDQLIAEDFVVGMRRTVDPKVASVYADIMKPIKNAEKIVDGKLDVSSLGVRALDSKTVEITLEKPTPYFLELLVHSTTFPIHQPSLKLYGNEFIKPGKLVSNGPFILQEWVVNSHLTVVKNKNYQDAAQVILNKVIFYPIIEQSAELNRYRSGDLDYTNIIPDVQYKWIKENLGQELYVAPQLGTYYVGFNLLRPPFKDNKNLRKALSLVIDKNIIAEKVLRSGQIATNHIVPDKINNYVPIVNRRTNFDNLANLSAEQRIILAQDYYHKAGYSKENPVYIKLTYNTSESHKSVALAMAAMFKKALGVKTELVNQEWKVFLRTRQERKETELFRDGWIGDYNDPSTFLDLFTSYHHQNHSGFKNPEYDNLITQASVQADSTKRAEILAEAEQILLEEAPIIPLYTYASRHLIKPKVGGFVSNILDMTYDRYIYIKKT